MRFSVLSAGAAEYMIQAAVVRLLLRQAKIPL